MSYVSKLLIKQALDDCLRKWCGKCSVDDEEPDEVWCYYDVKKLIAHQETK